MNDCGEMRIALGVYVLGAIEPGERTRLDSHLDGCPACRDELAGLAGLPALLGRVTERQIEQMAGPPPELLDSLLTRAAQKRRRLPILRRPPSAGRLWWAPAALAACALLLVGVLAGALLTSVKDEPVAVPVTPSSPSITTSPGAERIRAADAGVKGEIVLYRKKWGTKIELYLAGAPYGGTCRFFAVARDGQRDMLGSWHVAYRKGFGQYMGSTMFHREQLSSFEIVTLDGRPLLSIPA
ncbi:anti-sigma factor family protein [Actinomadura sp. 9N407]|uniref:anti-sigma factor family protein n=1 Tax=Actinomadura sp. 9N407 TaxID=3375154 RepID=UPI003798C59B